LGSIFGYFLSASMEEGLKHLSALGLNANDFRFSRIDLILFSFFVTLGFVTIENMIFLGYLFDEAPQTMFFAGIGRILFALPVHVLAATICALFWWKALSYKLFSPLYVYYFVLGYLLASLVHMFFNYASTTELTLILPIMAIGSYMYFTYWIQKDCE
jgi:hypothetical protein